VLQAALTEMERRYRLFSKLSVRNIDSYDTLRTNGQSASLEKLPRIVIIIDAVGAEKLLGKGDMLLSAAWNPFPVRIQGAYIDDEETDAVTEYVKKLGPPQYIEDEVFFDDDDTAEFEGEPGNDPLFERALEVVMGQGKASASYLQRRLKVGYNRAARLVEEMEERGIVGPAQGSRPRDILHMPSKAGS
jgi:DNA segregation ATPase FtsK/SpoIIIE, S-DNA-T family